MTATPKMWPRSFRRSGANPASPSGSPPPCTGGGVVVTLRRCSSPSAPRIRPVRRIACPRRHWAVDPGGDLGEDRVDLRVRPGRGVLTASGVGQPFPSQIGRESVPSGMRVGSPGCGRTRAMPNPSAMPWPATPSSPSSTSAAPASTHPQTACRKPSTPPSNSPVGSGWAVRLAVLPANIQVEVATASLEERGEQLPGWSTTLMSPAHPTTPKIASSRNRPFTRQGQSGGVAANS